MLEHRARGDYQPRLARPAHQLDRYDAVAPELKEIVRNPNPANPQHFPKQRAQDLLLRRARTTPRRRPPQPVPPQDGAAAPPRSRQAQCESRAASPAHPRARESPTPRPNASAQYPRCGTSGFPQHQTGPQQTAPPSAPHAPDSPAQAPPQICTAPPLPPPVQAANSRPTRTPACSRSAGQWEQTVESTPPQRSSRRSTKHYIQLDHIRL